MDNDRCRYRTCHASKPNEIGKHYANIIQLVGNFLAPVQSINNLQWQHVVKQILVRILLPLNRVALLTDQHLGRHPGF